MILCSCARPLSRPRDGRCRSERGGSPILFQGYVYMGSINHMIYVRLTSSKYTEHVSIDGSTLSHNIIQVLLSVRSYHILVFAA